MKITVTKNAWYFFNKALSNSSNNYGILFSSYKNLHNKKILNLEILNKNKYNSICNDKNTKILLNTKNMTKLYIDPINNEYIDGVTIDYIKSNYTSNSNKNYDTIHFCYDNGKNYKVYNSFGLFVIYNL